MPMPKPVPVDKHFQSFNISQHQPAKLMVGAMPQTNQIKRPQPKPNTQTGN